MFRIVLALQTYRDKDHDVKSCGVSYSYYILSYKLSNLINHIPHRCTIGSYDLYAPISTSIIVYVMLTV